MTEEELLLAPIRTVRELLDAGTVSTVELTEAALRRIDRRNPDLNAFSHIAAEPALRAARESAARIARGEQRGPLEGIVVAVKDNTAVTGMPLEAGSAVLRGRVAEQDAAVVTALKRAGAVLVGLTTMDEFALTTVGPARNPLDPDLTPGGSSGGSAVAVQAGMCAAAIGTDTGGSVRIPAHCCAITGLKPTHGLLPIDGIVPLAPSLDHVGVLARTVADAALFFEALLPARPVGLDTGLDTGVPDSPYRIGVPFAIADCDSAVWTTFRADVEQAAGTLVEVDLPDFAELGRAHWTILASELSDYHLGRFGTGEDRYDTPMREAIKVGAETAVPDYLAAQRTRGELRRHVDRLFEEVDFLALPTMATDTPRRGQPRVRLGGADVDTTAAMVRITALFNHTGHPAISVPPAAADRTRPAGIQLVAPHFHDHALLTVAARVAGPHHVPRPG